MDDQNQLQPAEWVEMLRPAAEEAGRALGQLPDGTWGDPLTAAVRKYGRRRISIVEIVLDPSGNQECPEALEDEILLEDLAGDAVYLFGEGWAERRLPVGTVREARGHWSDHRPWNDAVLALAETMMEAFESAIVASAKRLIASPPILSLADYPPPAPQPFGISPSGAELLIAEWMKHLVEGGAKVTRASGDGGVDVRGPRYVAQVKTTPATLASSRSVSQLVSQPSRGGQRSSSRPQGTPRAQSLLPIAPTWHCSCSMRKLARCQGRMSAVDVSDRAA